MIPAELRYSTDHEWVAMDGDTATVGITDHAQSQLGDITYVELPSTGNAVSAGDSISVVESVKAASDVCAPVSGTVAETNDALEGAPEKVNSDPYKEGWILRISGVQASEVDGLMSAADYEKFIESGS